MGAVPYTIPQCIQIAQISQVLINKDILSANFSTNQFQDKRHPRLLYIARKGLEWYYVYGTNATTLSDIANYVLALCGRYVQQALNIINQLAQSPPVLSGPFSVSVNVGDTGSFIVTATSSLPVTYQWYLNGVLVPEATNSFFSITNAQLSDNGDTVYVRVTNSAGTTTSSTAVLTVNAAIYAYTWYGSTDPNPMLELGIDTLTYQIQTLVTHNQPISITIPQAATPDMFFVTKIVNTETEKTTYYNTALNQGTIIPEDANYKSPYTFGTDIRYATRRSVSWDYTQPLILS